MGATWPRSSGRDTDNRPSTFFTYQHGFGPCTPVPSPTPGCSHTPTSHTTHNYNHTTFPA